MKNLLKKLKNSQEFWFAAIGGLNTILDFVILFGLTSLGISYLIANVFSTGITFINSFSLNKKITFKSVSKSKKELVREIALFIIVTLLGYSRCDNFSNFTIFRKYFKKSKNIAFNFKDYRYRLQLNLELYPLQKSCLQ